MKPVEVSVNVPTVMEGEFLEVPGVGFVINGSSALALVSDETYERLKITDHVKVKKASESSVREYKQGLLEERAAEVALDTVEAVETLNPEEIVQAGEEEGGE